MISIFNQLTSRKPIIRNIPYGCVERGEIGNVCWIQLARGESLRSKALKGYSYTYTMGGKKINYIMRPWMPLPVIKKRNRKKLLRSPERERGFVDTFEVQEK